MMPGVFESWIKVTESIRLLVVFPSRCTHSFRRVHGGDTHPDKHSPSTMHNTARLLASRNRSPSTGIYKWKKKHFLLLSPSNRRASTELPLLNIYSKTNCKKKTWLRNEGSPASAHAGSSARCSSLSLRKLRGSVGESCMCAGSSTGGGCKYSESEARGGW